MAWMIREDKLDQYQREFINNESRKKGSIWIKGFAGSGKSVLLVHHARSVLQREPAAKIVLLVYTLALVDLFRAALRELGIEDKVLVTTYYDFCRGSDRYDYVLCDEVQDLPRKALESMKSRAGQVIVAGDSNQSIYDVDVKWKHPVVSPSEIGDILDARPFTLSIVHRLTRSVIRAVNSLLPAMNIWGTANDPQKQDVQIRIGEAQTTETEVEYVWMKAQERPQITGGMETSVVLLPSHKLIAEFFDTLLTVTGKPVWSKVKNNYGKPDYDNLNSHLKKNGLKIQFVGNGNGSLQDAVINHNVLVMTYHSAKGLDFDDVFLPYLSASTSIARERGDVLFMVAMTRSRRNLYITHTGYCHEYVSRFANMDACANIDIDAAVSPPKQGGIVYDF